jgi:UDP-N-acetylglucosamine:LPS N-acetylglucosamine transferase
VKEKLKIALVCSHGGHLAEMNELKSIFAAHDFFYITYASETAEGLKPARFIKKFHDSPFELFAVWFRVFSILKEERPDVVFSTGAEIAIPVFLVAKIFFGCRLAYLESAAQVSEPSMTGRIVYWFCDLFLVQWEQLLKKYGPKAEYKGGLV